MVTITIYQDASGFNTGFTAKGHADFASYGEDIVCAAISAILQTTIIGLQEIVGIDDSAYTIDQGDVCVELSRDLSQQSMHDATLLIETMQLGLQSIAIDRNEYLYIEIRRV